jgi:hypothetical protein
MWHRLAARTRAHCSQPTTWTGCGDNGVSRARNHEGKDHDFKETRHVEMRHMTNIASILSVTLLLTGSGAVSLLVTYALLTLILRSMIFFWVSPSTHDFVLTAQPSARSGLRPVLVTAP